MKLTIIAFLAALALGLVGCSPQTAEKVEDATKAAGQDIKNETTKAGAAVVEGAEKAGSAMEGAVDKAGAAIDAGKVKLKVTNALLTGNLDAKDLDVSISGSTVTLKGSVATEANKTSATSLAKGAAGADMDVKNELTVRGN
jgi:osmotically-inducible protein OsmY